MTYIYVYVNIYMYAYKLFKNMRDALIPTIGVKVSRMFFSHSYDIILQHTKRISYRYYALYIYIYIYICNMTLETKRIFGAKVFYKPLLTPIIVIGYVVIPRP